MSSTTGLELTIPQQLTSTASTISCSKIGSEFPKWHIASHISRPMVCINDFDLYISYLYVTDPIWETEVVLL